MHLQGSSLTLFRAFILKNLMINCYLQVTENKSNQVVQQCALGIPPSPRQRQINQTYTSLKKNRKKKISIIIPPSELASKALGYKQTSKKTLSLHTDRNLCISHEPKKKDGVKSFLISTQRHPKFIAQRRKKNLTFVFVLKSNWPY